ncbi:hypothetical protein [Pedococcus soli]
MTDTQGDFEQVADDYIRTFSEEWTNQINSLNLAMDSNWAPTPAQRVFTRRFASLVNDVGSLLFDVQTVYASPAVSALTMPECEELTNALRLAVRESHRDDSSSFYTSLRHFMSTLDPLLVKIQMTGITKFPTAKDARADFLSRLSEVQRKMSTLKNEITQIELEELVGRANEAVVDIAESRAEAREARDDTVEAAGQTGAVTLGTNFKRFGRWEEVRAWIMRVISGALFGTSVYIGIKLSEDLKDAKFLSWEVARFAVVVPILLFAYYFLREAGHHRDAAQEARLNNVLLQSIKAYTDELSADDKYVVRAELGRRVFGKQDKAAAVLPDGADLIDPKDATSLVGAITALLGVALKK